MKYIAVLFFIIISSCSQGLDLVVFPKEALDDVFLSLEAEDISFSSILEAHKGETIFIDVWASWCRDCIEGMPTLKKLQKEYPEATFLFLSLDRSEESWKRGIKKYSLEGNHYFVSSGWKGAFGKAIDLDWIPRYMVVDTTGTISLYRAVELNDFRIKEALKKE
ncbi:MAG: thiol-disulfide isomerase/thioredoxin [Patiriisocius sp.]|jgi:thiol-disulfide isomerase/thioredoxin